MPFSVTATGHADIAPIPSGLPINAVLLDDSNFDRRRMRRLSLDTGLPIYLDEASSIEGLKAMLDQDRFDLILLDYRLSSGDGLEALDMVRNHRLNAHVPTIMITGVEDPGIAVRAMRLGCQDFLTKTDMTAEVLREAVEAAIAKTGIAHGTERIRQDMVEAVSKTVMAEWRSALQPEIAGLVREVRDIRTSATLPGFDVAAKCEKLDARCATLWSSLNRLGQDHRMQ